MSEKNLFRGLQAFIKSGSGSGSENGRGLAHTQPDAAPASLFGAEADPAAVALPERKGGRPKGAKNIKTRDLMRMMELRGFRDPILFLADVYSRPVEELKENLGIPAADAFALQVKAAEAVAPYVHAKVTPEKVEVPKVPTIVVIQGAGEQAQKAGGEAIDAEYVSLDIAPPASEENQ